MGEMLGVTQHTSEDKTEQIAVGEAVELDPNTLTDAERRALGLEEETTTPETEETAQ